MTRFQRIGTGQNAPVKRFLPTVVIVVALAAIAAASARPAAPKTRPCGYLAIGKGWHVHATRNVLCINARKLMTKFFTLPRCAQAQQTPAKPCTINHYLCVESYVASDIGLVRCKRTARLVTAKSNQ